MADNTNILLLKQELESTISDLSSRLDSQEFELASLRQQVSLAQTEQLITETETEDVSESIDILFTGDDLLERHIRTPGTFIQSAGGLTVTPDEFGMVTIDNPTPHPFKVYIELDAVAGLSDIRALPGKIIRNGVEFDHPDTDSIQQNFTVPDGDNWVIAVTDPISENLLPFNSPVIEWLVLNQSDGLNRVGRDFEQIHRLVAIITAEGGVAVNVQQKTFEDEEVDAYYHSPFAVRQDPLSTSELIIGEGLLSVGIASSDFEAETIRPTGGPFIILIVTPRRDGTVDHQIINSLVRRPSNFFDCNGSGHFVHPLGSLQSGVLPNGGADILGWRQSQFGDIVHQNYDGEFAGYVDGNFIEFKEGHVQVGNILTTVPEATITQGGIISVRVTIDRGLGTVESAEYKAGYDDPTDERIDVPIGRARRFINGLNCWEQWHQGYILLSTWEYLDCTVNTCRHSIHLKAPGCMTLTDHLHIYEKSEGTTNPDCTDPAICGDDCP